MNQSSELDARCLICKWTEGNPLCHAEAKSAQANSNRPRIHRVYSAGQIIFHEGDPPAYVHYIHSGAVKLYKSGEARKPIVIRMLLPGEVFGYRAVISDEDLAATAEAVQETVICSVPRGLFMQSIRSQPDLAVSFLNKLCQELRASEELWLQQSQESATKHTLRVLQQLAGDSGRIQTGGARQSRFLRRSEIAELVGISSETFSRALKKLAEKGLLSVNKTAIILTKTKEHTLLPSKQGK
ncbi:Crp/Fnr family transcriptional regulator [bacterium]|nr:Crp/Fnr family transcriptional regulator [bacterium]